MSERTRGRTYLLFVACGVALVLASCAQFSLYERIRALQSTSTSSIGLKISPGSALVTAGSSITFSATGGSTPYTFSIAGGGGSIAATSGVYTAPSTSGTATVKVTDSSGDSATGQVTIVSASTGPVAIYPAAVTMASGTSLSFSVIGGTPPYTYALTAGSGSVSSTGVYQANPTSGSATITAIDGTGSTSSANIQIVLNGGTLTINPASATMTTGTTLTFAVTNGTAPYTYSIVSGGGTIGATSGVYTTPAAAGTAKVQVTDGASATSVATVTIVPPPLVISPAAPTVPEGGVVDFAAAGGTAPYTYTVSAGGVGGSVTSTAGVYTAPGATGADTVVVTDASGKASSATVTVVGASQVVIAPATQTLAAGASYQFSATGGVPPYTYSLFSGSGSITTAGLYTAPSSASTDTVRVTDSVGSTSDATVTVTPHPVAITPLTPSVNAGGNLTFSASGGTGGYTYSVLSGGAGGSILSSGVYTAPAAPGTDTVQVKDSSGATSDATVTIVPASQLLITPASVTVGVGKTYTFGATGGTAPYTFSLLSGSGSITSAGVYTASASASTDTVRVTDFVGATSEATVTVVPALAISPATLSVSAGANYQFSATGGESPYTYTMASGSGTVNSSGFYTAPNAASTDTVRVTDVIGETSTATVTVAAPVAPLTINPTSPSVTEGGAVSFNASGGTPPYAFTVLAGGAGGAIVGSTGAYTAPIATGTDTVRVTDSQTRTANATVTVTAPPPFAISPTSVSVVANSTYQFGASGGVPPYTYSLYSGTGSINSSGLYTAPAAVSSATVRVTDSIGETSNAAVTILPTLAISPTTTGVLTGGTVNFTASGGSGSNVYSVLAGGAGGTINSSTGVYHAPSTTGTDTVRVTDSSGDTSDATVSIVAGSQLLISPTSLTISAGNSYQFGASGGTPSYTFSMFSGSGSISTSGLYTAPASASTDTVRVTDSSGTTSYATVNVVSGGPLTISPTSATVPEGGTFTFAGSGGTPPYIFTLSGSGSIGALSGTYSASGTVGANVATITMSDNAGGSQSATVSVVPAGPTNLTAVPAANHSNVTLSWTNNTSDPSASVAIERSADSGTTYTTLTTQPAGTTSYVDTTGAPNTLYVYRVKAMDGTLSSAYSNVAFVVQ